MVNIIGVEFIKNHDNGSSYLAARSGNQQEIFDKLEATRQEDLIRMAGCMGCQALIDFGTEYVGLTALKSNGFFGRAILSCMVLEALDKKDPRQNNTAC